MAEENYFNTRYKFDHKREAVWKVLCQYIQKDIQVDSKVLDLGAGYSHFINNIKAAEKYAVDTWDGFQRYAGSDVKTYVSRSDDLTMFDDGTLDVVFASNLFEHLERDELYKTLDEIRRILKRAGTLILLQPNFRYSYRNYFDDYTHKLIFTDKSLNDLLIAYGFKVTRLVSRWIPFSMDTHLPKCPWLVKLYMMLPIRLFASQMYCVAVRM